jgi:hypothetical protein
MPLRNLPEVYRPADNVRSRMHGTTEVLGLNSKSNYHQMSYNGISGDYTTLLGQNARACEIQGRKRGSTLRVVKGFAGPNTVAALLFLLCKAGYYPEGSFSVKYMAEYTCRSCNCTSLSCRLEIMYERIFFLSCHLETRGPDVSVND